ncbi:MAG: hypothetical protein U9N72_11120 [Bacteroidota bacterium]|nr:hypothetical protein [Bacteroidota bacterium]
MDLKSAINIIIRDLKEAGDLIDDLKNKPELPDLQIELVRSKCKSAEDLIKIVGDIITDAGNEVDMKADIKESIINNDISNVQEEIAEGEKREKEEEEEKEKTLTEETVDTPREEIITDHSDPEDSTIKTEKKSEQIIADRFAHLSSRINEKVGDTKKAEGKTRSIPVTDLNRAIGINDRFYFIRELFSGKEEPYRQTINSLNNVSTKEEATRILNDTLKDMADSEPARQLLELVERKLSAK